jgi:hypothetical protein
MTFRNMSAVVCSACLCAMLFGCTNKAAEPPEPLAAPILSLPNNGSSFISDTPALSWSDTSAQAISFTVQVATDADFSVIVTSGSAASHSFTITSGLLNNNVTYFWRVSASDGQRTSEWSVVFSFTTGVPAPSLTYPQEGDLYMPDTLTLAWYPVDGATTYYINVSTDYAFSAISINDSSSSASFAISSPLASSSTYYWRVSASKPQGTSAWSTVRSFTTWDTLPAPELSSPSDGAIGVVPAADSLRWSFPPAFWAISSYHVQVSTVSDFSSGVIIDDAAVYPLYITITALSGGTQYYWRVAAIDFRQRHSEWSAVRSFTTQ